MSDVEATALRELAIEACRREAAEAPVARCEPAVVQPVGGPADRERVYVSGSYVVHRSNGEWWWLGADLHWHTDPEEAREWAAPAVVAYGVAQALEDARHARG